MGDAMNRRRDNTDDCTHDMSTLFRGTPDMIRAYCFACMAYSPIGKAKITRAVREEIMAATTAQLAIDYDDGIHTAETATAQTNIGGPRTYVADLARDIYRHRTGRR